MSNAKSRNVISQDLEMPGLYGREKFWLETAAILTQLRDAQPFNPYPVGDNERLVADALIEIANSKKLNAISTQTAGPKHSNKIP